MTLIDRLKSLWSRGRDPAITLIGYPFRATGRAEGVRSTWRALVAAGIRPSVIDLDNQPDRREVLDAAVEGALVDRLQPNGIRLFHCNGNEARGARTAIEKRSYGNFAAGYNIVEPAWELPLYPAEWSAELAAFDEVWVASDFVFHAINGTVPVPVLKLPNASQPHVEIELSRAHFGIPADDYIVTVVFDLWSFASRKNPLAVIDCFRSVVAQRPGAKVHLVIKTSHRQHDPAASEVLRSAIAELGSRATLIETILNNNEAKNLIRCSDCFISLHRSEGFGRVPAEAMFMGKPVIATGWSGNMEFMSAETSFPVAYKLIPVGTGEYPFGDGQVWADADVEDATRILLGLIDDPTCGPAVGARAKAHMLEHFSDVTIGKRYRERFRQIARFSAKAARVAPR